MFKLIILLLLFFASLMPATETSPPRYFEFNGHVRDIGDYSTTEEAFLKGNPDYVLYDASKLTTEILENRKGTVIVERCVGLVTETHNNKHGIILNDNDSYISYNGFEEKLCEGTIVVTYFVYNANNNYIDDITERYDFVVCREYED